MSVEAGSGWAYSPAAVDAAYEVCHANARWLSFTVRDGSTEPNSLASRALRSTAWAMAWRAAAWLPIVDRTLNSSDWRVRDGWIELWELGSAEAASSEANVNDPGWDTAVLVVARGPIHEAGSWLSETVTPASDEGVPHHDGFRTRTAVPSADTDLTSNGPADTSTAGSNVTKPVFHPTLRAMWAGTMWSKRIRQSAKGVANTTLTVRPPWDPVTDATSR